MRHARLAAALVVLLPAAASAQLRHGGEIFVSQNQALPSSPVLGGLALTSGAGPLSLRLSGALTRRAALKGEGSETPWTADADLVLNSAELAQVFGIALGGFAPAGFVGIGRQGVYRPGAVSPSMGTLSYGGGASYELFDGLRLAAEARYRVPLQSDVAPPEGFARSGREVRVGLSFGFGGTGGRSASSASRGRTGGSARVPSAPASATARRVLDTADDYLGAPYKYGGESLATGIDCSAFTQLVFDRNGVRLPRTSRQQAVVGEHVTPAVSALRPGDLVFFASSGSRIDHVAIYAGDGRIIHATSSGGGVRYDDLSTSRGQWFESRMVSARRVLADGRSLVTSLDTALRIKQLLDPPDRAPAPPR